MKKNLIIVMLLFINLVFSQGEANIWYFGLNAGLDFNSGSPVTLTDGQLNTSEGCATISDADGQLLFYTDGVWVFNKNHEVMTNGSGLMGDFSTTQSATIVPKPGSNTLYYIFTIDSEANPNGFRYSMVDIAANGGLGEVTPIKNVLVYTPTCEKIAVIKHANTTDFWIITHGFGNNNFYAHLLTNGGLSSVPVVSSVGFSPLPSSLNPDNNFSTHGYMKIASNGSKLAIAHSSNDSETGIVQLMDFNNTTGVISNPITLLEDNLYGVEFSPSNNVLYCSGYPLKIIQFNLLAADIASSAIIFTNLSYPAGALQLGPDGKIYFAQYGINKIGVINNPNTIGVGCSIQDLAIDLEDKVCYSGLPAFNQSFFYVPDIQTVNQCFGEPTQFSFNNSSITSATWNFGDGTTSTLLSPTHIYAAPGDYNVSVVVSSPQGTSTSTKTINISEVPVIANNISNQSICGTVNLAYNLSQFNSTVLGAQSATTYGVAYFSSMANAIAHSNSLATNQLLSLGNTAFYVKIYNLNNTSCHVIDDFEVTLYEQPIAYNPSPYFICETAPYDGMDIFYLSTKNNEILNGQNPASFSISYHPTLTDANDNSDVLPLSYTNTLPTETVYARIQNNSNASCFSTTPLELKVVQEPAVITVSDYRICDDASNDGIASFDLSTKTSEILNGQPASLFEVHYFLTLLDAQNQTNAILNPITNSSNNQEIFYTIIANGNATCKADGSFFLKVDSLPVAHTVSDFFQCDDLSNDGVENFNLGLKNSEILGNQSATNFSVTYFDSALDAQNNTNPLPYSYINSSNPQTIFARIANIQNNKCHAIENFQIGVNNMPVAFEALDMVTCDDETNNGREPFDLNFQNASILGSQDLSEHTVTYHVSFSEANAGTNALGIPYENNTNPQTIYARVTHNLNASCFAVSDFEISVMEKPLFNMKDVYSICEGFTVQVQAPAGFSSYEWSTGATTQNVILDEPGNYSITVTKDYGNIICESRQDFTVYNSNKATITSITTNDWTQSENTITVMVSGDGVYEYSLNGTDFQDDNHFTGLSAGDYIVYVRDKKGCGTVEEEIFLLSYPKYFTPNGDGYNDYWQINFSHIEPDMKISIFDRYGKLITTFSGNSPGWDGTFNGRLLPSSDYWFLIERENGKEYKGHFSLKR